jgi:hypothetical protein
LTFECPSRLAVLGDFAFRKCKSLHSICIPANLGQIAGLAIAGSGIGSVTVDPQNRSLTVLGGFLVDLHENCLIRYLGTESEVTIRRDVKAISAGCFRELDSIESVKFECGSDISRFSRSAFKDCGSLQPVCIPSSVEIIAKSCFRRCHRLSNVTFEPGSRISILGQCAFCNCTSLQSV